MRWIIPAAVLIALISKGVPGPVAAALTASVYLIECWAYPYTRCRSCGGSKRHLSPSGADAWRHCSVCSGSGERLRTGRKILDMTRK